MLKIGGVKRSRGQYDDPGVFFVVWRNFRQARLKGAKKIGQTPHIAVVEQGGHNARHRGSVFERIPGPKVPVCGRTNPHCPSGPRARLAA